MYQFKTPASSRPRQAVTAWKLLPADRSLTRGLMCRFPPFQRLIQVSLTVDLIIFIVLGWPSFDNIRCIDVL